MFDSDWKREAMKQYGTDVEVHEGNFQRVINHLAGAAYGKF